MIVTDKLSTESLHAFIDEQLTDEQYAQVESQLDKVPEKVLEIQQCQIINERLRDVFDPVVQEEIPQELIELGLNGLEFSQDDHESDAPELDYEDGSSNGLELNDDFTSPGYASMQTMPDLDHFESLGDDSYDENAYDEKTPVTISEDVNSAALNSALDNDAIGAAKVLSNRPGKARRLFSQNDEFLAQTPSPQDVEEILKSIDSLSLETSEPESAVSSDEQFDTTVEPVYASSEDSVEDLDLEEAAYHLPQDDGILDTLPDSEADEIVSADQITQQIFEQEQGLADVSLQTQYHSAKHNEPADMEYQVGDEAIGVTDEIIAVKSSAPESGIVGKPGVDSIDDFPVLDVLIEQQAALKSQYINQLHTAAQKKQQVHAQSKRAPQIESGTDQPGAPTAGTTPDDLVAEFFSQRKIEMDFEVNEVLKHFDMVSGNMPQPGISGVVENSPVLKFKAKMSDAFVIFKQKASVIKGEFTTKKQKLSDRIKKFRSKPDTDAMAMQDVVFLDDDGQFAGMPATEVQEAIAQKDVAHETVMQETFFSEKVSEKVSEKFSETDPQADIQETVFQEHVPQEIHVPELAVQETKSKKTKPQKAKVLKAGALKSKIKKARASKTKSQESIAQETVAQETIVQDSIAQNTKVSDLEQSVQVDGNRQAEIPLEIAALVNSETGVPADKSTTPGYELHSTRAKYVANLIKYETDFVDQPLQKRMLEKARIWFMYYGRIAWDFLRAKLAVLYARLAQRGGVITKAVESMAPENRVVAGGAILLVVGLVVGGSFVALVAQPTIVINDNMENLAVDAHIFYNQQMQNLSDNVRTIKSESLQWLPYEMDRSVRLMAGTQVDGFQQQSALLIPTTDGYATLHTFKNSNNQLITLLISSNQEDARDTQVTCRVLKNVDGLCNWTRHAIHYVAVANLSSSRVRDFSQKLLEKL